MQTSVCLSTISHHNSNLKSCHKESNEDITCTNIMVP